jgi:two-component system chemotaxis response regulator CheY
MPAAAALQVMLVDDQRVIRELVRGMLLDLGCRQVTECGDGKEALRALELRPVNLIISDLNMPNMDGLEFLRTVRAHPSLGKTAFIMLTSRAETDLVRQAVSLGVNNYIIKPFNAATVKAKIEAVLGPLT